MKAYSITLFCLCAGALAGLAGSGRTTAAEVAAEWSLLAQGTSAFTVSNGSGGAVRLGTLPGSGVTGVILRESDASGEGASSRASLFAATPLEQEHPLVARINEVLARPAEEGPAFFVVTLRVARVMSSDKLLGAGCSLECGGPSVPRRILFQAGEDFSARIKALGPGESAEFSGEYLSGLCFGVWPAAGRQRVNSVKLNASLRVETGATPEELAIAGVEVKELPLPPRAAGMRLQVAGEPWSAPGIFWRAAAGAGMSLLPPAQTLDSAAQIVVATNGMLEKVEPAQFSAALLRGAGVIAGFSGRENQPLVNGTTEFLPVNPWSACVRNRRYDSGIVRAREDGPFAALPPLAVDWRYDLHLPYAAIESGEHRYAEFNYGKNLLNGDWRVEQVCDLDGRLPALVSGRYGPGRVALFCGDVFDGALTRSAGYAAWVEKVLALVRPVAEVAAPTALQEENLSIRVPMLQSAGVAVEIGNRGAAGAAAWLTYKIRNQAGELTCARIVPVTLPAAGAVRVPLTLADSAVGAETVRFAAEVPYWSVEAGLLTAGRDRVLARTQARVCTASPLSITVRENTDSYATLRDWAGMGDYPDGRLAYRYVYQAGETPRVEVTLNNGRVNLAPLATARDGGWPDNPTISGLNDLSYSLSSVRGRLPKQGGWAGKQRPAQQLRLEWPEEVVIAGTTLAGYGGYRNRQRNNPRQFTLREGTGAGQANAQPLVQETAAEFRPVWGAKPNGTESTRAYYDRDFSPARLRGCVLDITALDPALTTENPHYSPANCSLLEWEVYGWPAAALPAEAKGVFRAVWEDLAGGTPTVLAEEELAIPALQGVTRAVTVPAAAGLTAGRLVLTLRCGALSAERIFPVLFVRADAPQMQNKKTLYPVESGLLCSPGMVQADSFGKGMNNYIQGWGGPHDQLWMLLHHQMEWAAGARADPARMLTLPGRICHYTNPFRQMPNGELGWDYAAGKFLEKSVSGEWRDRFPAGESKRLHLIGSDRWNGIPVGTSFGWGEYCAFDRYLREKTGRGLQARGRAQIGQEIITQYADHWQRWSLQRYAQSMLRTQEAFAKAGIEFTYETHGSFPLCGGELGAQLARTHTGVGTDLFWELRAQDLYWSVGSRFGVVAVNPDLRSGAYQQWGWVNSELNRYWFANNSAPAPAIRQWYAAYFCGRVDLRGQFAPYHAMGFSSQGDVGTKMLPYDYREFYRVRHTTVRVRPEAATGFGLVASWPAQERALGPRCNRMGFGLFPSDDRESVEMLFGQAYHKLVKAGLPVSFVTATDALAKWAGTQPLVLVGGYGYNAAELREVARLNRAGTPILALGGQEGAAMEDEARAQAARLFGVSMREGRPVQAAGGRVIRLAQDGVLYLRPGGQGEGWAAYCPVEPAGLSGRAAQALVREILALCGNPLVMDAGLCATAMHAQGGLWLALTEQGDVDRTAAVQINPGWFRADLAGKAVQVFDLDGATRLAATAQTDGSLRVRVPLAGTGGRLLLLLPATP